MITPEQLEFKKGKIGASQCAAALGVSPWQSQAGLYHEILGNVIPEPLGEKGIIGNEMEPVIIKAYERETGIKVYPVPDTLIHPKHPWMIAHLDGAMPEYQMTLEIKNIGWTVAHHWGENGDPKGTPMYVTAQCVHQAILAEVDRIDVAAFFGGNELRVYPLDITPEAKASVMNGLTRFWDKVTNKVQPEMTDKDIDLLKQLYWQANKDVPMYVESTATALMFDDYRRLKNKIKPMVEKADTYKAKIQNVMGDCTVIMRGEDMEFTWRKTKDTKQTDWENVARDLLGCFAISDHDGMSREAQDYENDAIAALFKKITEDNTKTKRGHRQFLDKAK